MILIVMMLVILCTACGTEDSDFRFSHVVDVPKERLEELIVDDVKEEQEIQKTEPDMTEEEFAQITRCLNEQVPEIFDEWNDYVVEVSEGKAHMMERMGGDYVPEDVYRDYAKTEYLGKYYCVYVGESWDDHCVNWAYLYVREDFDEVLWYDFIPLMDSDYCVFYLDEWRNSEWYPKLEK